MKIKITARHFKANSELKLNAKLEVEKLKKYFDGILNGEVIFSYIKNDNSQKSAEIVLSVHNHILKASDTSEDFLKSLVLAIKKIEKQLIHVKSKFREKNMKVLRKVKLEIE